MNLNPVVVRGYAARMATELHRRVTLREAEADIVQVIQRVARGLSRRFAFGYHTPEDVEQDAIIDAIEVLSLVPPRYDTGRPLENFLHIHLRNQLSNFRRKHYARLEPPCPCCDISNPPAEPCQKWLDWSRRNTSKQNIMRPLDMSNVSDEGEPRMSTGSGVENEAVSNELLARIDSMLPIDLRSDYLRMREHVEIPKARRQRVRDAVLAIIGKSGGDEDGD